MYKRKEKYSFWPCKSSKMLKYHRWSSCGQYVLILYNLGQSPSSKTNTFVYIQIWRQCNVSKGALAAVNLTLGEREWKNDSYRGRYIHHVFIFSFCETLPMTKLSPWLITPPLHFIWKCVRITDSPLCNAFQWSCSLSTTTPAQIKDCSKPTASCTGWSAIKSVGHKTAVLTLRFSPIYEAHGSFT